MIQQIQFIEAARKYKGVPFHHAGRSKNGLDCLGLIILSGIDIGLPLAYNKGYSRVFSGKWLVESISQYCNPVEIMEPGDILVFSMLHCPCHFGIFCGADSNDNDSTFIHAYEPLNKVVEQRYSRNWIKRFHSAYRLKEQWQL